MDWIKIRYWTHDCWYLSVRKLSKALFLNRLQLESHFLETTWEIRRVFAWGFFFFNVLFENAKDERSPSFFKRIHVLFAWKFNYFLFVENNRNLCVELLQQNILLFCFLAVLRLMLDLKFELKRVEAYDTKTQIHNKSVLICSYPQKIIVKCIKVNRRFKNAWAFKYFCPKTVSQSV